MNFTDRIKSYIMAESLLEQGDTVVAGVSGGADSLCLFLLLMQLKEEFKLKVAVVHVNHCIRGRDSDEDEEFVRSLCRRFGVHLTCVRRDVLALSAEWKRGTEETGRMVRHSAYAGCVKQVFAGKAKVALAHHRDDLCETVILSMIRGSGINGIAAIRPRTSIETDQGAIEVIRPLLCVGRAEIETWLKSCNEIWRDDRTNSDNEYTRNRIRHMIMPLLTAENPKAMEHIANTAGIAALTSDYMRGQAQSAVFDLSDDAGRLEIKGLLSLHPALFPEVVRLWVVDAAGTELFLGSERIKAVRRLISGRKGRIAELSGGWIIKKQGGFIAVTMREDDDMRQDRIDRDFVRFTKPAIDKAVDLVFAGYRFTFKAQSGKWEPGDKQEDENFFSILTSYDRIADICLRLPLPGDRMVISDRGDHKKISRIFIDARIPVQERADIPVMLSGQDIVWVVGVRDCPVYFTDDSDEYVLLCQARRITG